MATKPVAKPVAKPAPVAKPVAKPAPVVNTAAAQRTAQLAQQQAAQKAAQQAAAQKAAQQAAAQKAAQQAAQQKAQAAANQAVQQKAAQKAAALKASAEKAAQQQAAQKAAQQQTVARAQAAQKAAQARQQQIAQQARTPAPVPKPSVPTKPPPMMAPPPASTPDGRNGMLLPTPPPAPIGYRGPIDSTPNLDPGTFIQGGPAWPDLPPPAPIDRTPDLPGAVQIQDHRYRSPEELAAEFHHHQGASGMPLPQQPGEQFSSPRPGQLSGGNAMFGQAQRDPQYAGMPDDMYNNMMAFYQRTGSDGPMTMDVKPWDQWMMMNRPSTGRPPANMALPDDVVRNTLKQGASGMPGPQFQPGGQQGLVEASFNMPFGGSTFAMPGGPGRTLADGLIQGPPAGSSNVQWREGPNGWESYNPQSQPPAPGPVNPADMNSSLALTPMPNPGWMNQGQTGNYQLPAMPNTGIQYPNFQTDPVAAQYVQQASTVRPPTGFSG